MEDSAMNGTCPQADVVFSSVVVVLFSVVVILGFFGNLLVILVVVSNSDMRTSTNALIVSLASADLLFIIFCVPFTAIFYISGWWLGYATCVVFQYFTYVPVYGSVYTLVLLSVDRYLAVVHAIRSLAWRTQRNTAAAVAVMWTAIGLSHVPFALDVGVVHVQPCNCSSGCPPPVGVCTNLKFFDDPLGGRFSLRGKVFYTMFNVFGYLLPFAIIITLYVLLLQRLLHGRSARMAKSTEAARSKRRVTRMVVIVVAIFGTCWLPIHAVFALQSWHKDMGERWFRYFQMGAQILAYMNSCMNPIVYAFVSDKFRQAFATFLGLSGRRGASNAQPSTKNPGQSELLEMRRLTTRRETGDGAGQSLLNADEAP